MKFLTWLSWEKSVLNFRKKNYQINIFKLYSLLTADNVEFLQRYIKAASVHFLFCFFLINIVYEKTNSICSLWYKAILMQIKTDIKFTDELYILETVILRNKDILQYSFLFPPTKNKKASNGIVKYTLKI